MKVILLKDIKDIGKKYEVKEVKEGYARNYLIPKGLVKAATPSALEWAEKKQKELEEKAEEDLKKAQGVAGTLDGFELQIPVETGEKGQLYEQVGAQKISEELKKQGYEIKKSQIDLKDPIEELGEFPVKIKVEHNLEAEVTVIVSSKNS